MCGVENTFQNILCYGLLPTNPYAILVLPHFKTSCVTVYLAMIEEPSRTCKAFQNTLCYGLPMNFSLGHIILLNFKTSYVTVYQFFAVGVITLRIFQNILCYGLPGSIFLFFDFLAISKHPMLQFTFPCFLINIILICYFKTSYVTVYLSIGGTAKQPAIFQNILCYGLPARSCERKIFSYYFKTSYVTVYQ